MAGLQQGNQPLPSKESSLFRQIVKFYETKQYKKGVKAADQILKRFPEHGETLAMKGLILNCMDRKDEAQQLVRQALRCDLKSHVCWHVYGLIYRSERDYKEAIKCYMNALRLDKDNLQILRDLALLQVQTRDIAGFVETRQKLLSLKANNRNNWISFAIAHHLDANYDVAIKVVDAYASTLDDIPTAGSDAYEHSEMLLYKAMLLDEGGRLQEAVTFLDDAETMIKDKLGRLEMRASLLLRLNHGNEAADAYRGLLNINANNYRYHEGLQRALGLTPAADGSFTSEQQQKLDELYSELQGTHPKSMACKRIPLDFKEGEAFAAAADEFVRPFLVKGIPSLFSALKQLYRDAAKQAALQSLFERLLQSVNESSALPEFADKPGTRVDAPQAKVWILMYLAQHYDVMQQTNKALQCICDAIQHTPTLLELYIVKSKILKHAGDPDGAMRAADEARKMDLADRYLNCVAVKRMFQAGDVAGAEKTAALFTKDGDSVVSNNLFDMQCMWYELAAGNAHYRKREYGKALKKFHAISQHFADFTEDQLDFHGYCVRKMTLRSYIKLLRMEDTLYGNVAYSKAAWGAIKCYLDLHDQPQNRDAGDDLDEAAIAAMSAEERKKYKQRKKKEEQRRKRDDDARKSKAAAEAAAAQAAAEQQQRQQQGAAAKKKPGQKEDPDPDGAKLAAAAAPLDEAAKFVAVLKQHSTQHMLTHCLAYAVHIRKGRLLLALQAINGAIALSTPHHPDTHCLIVRFCAHVREEKGRHIEGAARRAEVMQIVDEEVQQLLGGCSIEEYNDAFVANHASASLQHCCAAAEMTALLQPQHRQRGVDLLLNWDLARQPIAAHAAAVDAHKMLLNVLKDTAAASKWHAKCAELYRWSAYFDGPDREQAAATMTENGAVESMESLSVTAQ